MKTDKINLPRPKTYVKNFYNKDGKTLVYKSRYIKTTNELLKDVFFHQDGKTVSQIIKYENGNIVREVFFNALGKFMGYVDKETLDILKSLK